jgi:hypothetical protein
VHAAKARAIRHLIRLENFWKITGNIVGFLEVLANVVPRRHFKVF